MLSSHNWLRLISPDFNLRNLFTLNWEALGSGLTSFGGLQPATESLCASVTDVLLGWRNNSDALVARGSRLVPDKARLGFRFPCDGPGRGGTWDVQRRICGGLVGN